MIAYPAIDELELEIRAGRGVAVIVEGNSYEEDAWFYGQWFNDRASQITFFPQNGWPRVVEAVAELRRRCPDVPVYGVIDRDFASDDDLDADFATQGILRTPRYTLENYLLVPDCWAQVFAFIFRRQGGVPDGWDDPVRVQGYIEDAYRDCLDLAAYNFAIHFGNSMYPKGASKTPKAERTYRERPNALANIDPVATLNSWGKKLGFPEDLGKVFSGFLGELNRGGPPRWEKSVSGKYVLRALHQCFPRLPRTGQFSLDHYLNQYLRECPNPPPDLVGLIERIIEDAGR
jgi:hypothetical protein